MNTNTCCFLGHRKIIETAQLKEKLYEVIENLIVNKNVDTFLFGSGSQFNDLCHEVVTDAKEKYSHIKRIYVRAKYPYISDNYKNYLLKDYEDTYFPQKLIKSGKAAYVERNYEMIKSSTFCIVYYDEKIAPATRKSGTKIAIDYATKSEKIIFNVAK